MHDCPCCGAVTYNSSDQSVLCDDCDNEGCLMTRDSVGDLGYWDCMRPDLYEYDPVYDVFLPGPYEITPDGLDMPSYGL